MIETQRLRLEPLRVEHAEEVVTLLDAIASHEGKPILGVFNADPAQACTFGRLAALDVDLACFGHGDPLLGGAHTDLARAAAEI